MLEGIKSNFIIQNIFSFASQEIKFNLVKYNKNLQKKLDINLFDYKNLSGKYIVYEKNGKGKEYNLEDELIFEGEYLKGKRNGKRKEYNHLDGKLEFEGEYLDGKRWNGKGYDGNDNIIYILKEGKGYVKEYYYDGELIFEGEYLNGKRWNGKEYNKYGKLRFEGEYLNNLKKKEENI